MQQRQTEPYLATWLHGRGGSLGLPVGGNFELTARCNFHCPMCYVHLSEAETVGRELSAEQWIALARQAVDRGMMFALITGGEPFVRRDFFEIYGAMKAMGLMISINTNGSLLSGEIRRRLLEDPPARINLSLYGGCRETYRNMCGQDAFQQVTDNIRALKEAGVDVRVNVSLTPYNRQDAAPIFHLCQELGVHAKATGYMYPPVRVPGGTANSRLTAEEAARCTVEWDQLRLTPEQFEQRARSMHELTAVEVRDCGADPEAGVECRAGHSTFWLTWDGRMLPCGMMPGPTAYPLEEGFDAAWEKIRRETRKIRMPAACGTCAKRQVCPVCAAICVAETGRFDGVPEYVCRQTEETVRLSWQACRERNGQ